MKMPEKIILLGPFGKLETNALELVAAFLALVIRHARIWFLSNWKEVYGHSKIRWQLNLGIPARNYDDKTIKQGFLTAARAAWWLSIQKGPVTFALMRDAVRQARRENFDPGIHPDYINVVPELAAEVAGYARSPFRRPGLHLIVDVGASTMDIATFRLDVQSGEFRYAFLCAEVNENACKNLHRERIRKVFSELSGWVKLLKKTDDHEVLGSPAHYQPPRVSVEEVDERFVSRAAIPIRRIIATTKTQRDPNAPEWQTGVPLFVCGGGGELPLFREQLKTKVEKGLRNYQWKGFIPMSLRMPEDLTAEGLGTENYHRLAVAYGLSFFFQDIGEIVPPSEIEDIEPTKPIRDFEDRFVGKEQV
ncbi:MAG: hypothetical protein QW835_06695 [Candidatus Hadarchaeum sp.]